LEDWGIKLDLVVSDILGVSGRAMLRALLAGERDAEVLAELAKGRLPKKLPELRLPGGLCKEDPSTKLRGVYASRKEDRDGFGCRGRIACGVG
jgi:hypothetical protein